jgi:molybdopterin converting factor small subunit
MAVRVDVKYYGSIGRTAGCSGESIELPENSVLSNLVQALAARHGERMEQILVRDGELRAEAAILINGRPALSQQGLATALKAEDKATIVVLVPMLTGG